MRRRTLNDLAELVTRARGMVALVAVTACASAGGSSGAGSPSQPTPVQPVITGRSQAVVWPVKTREHVDLWLHGFALLSADSSRVPLFRIGYRDELTVRKNRANVLTQLDVNHDKLARQLASSQLLVNAQFVPFYFTSLEEMHTAIDRFVQSDGNPSVARTPAEAAGFAVLGSYFRTGADRAWLALFASSIWDEDTKFFHSYWTQQQRERANVIDSTTAMWTNLVRPRIQRFLVNTQQRDGDILLSLPLGGEGRTLSASGNVRTSVAVTFPDTPGNAPQAMYVLAHELVGTLTNAAIADNTSPADQRSGVADRYASSASVRGGLMLLQKFVPELADGYARYYVTATGATPTATPRVQLASLFPLPDAIRDAIARQINMVDSGI
ncbi:MAG: hypothetical protein M3R65_12200 [Gemmatimonadota bacterium]|nr:hypothetical protein [Gemmatimonadota bacterium]